MKKIKDYMKDDDFYPSVKKQSAEKNYEWFKRFFPDNRGEAAIYVDFYNAPYPRLTYSYDKNGVDFEMEDEDGNIDTLTLEWENDVHYVDICLSLLGPHTAKISTVDGKYLELVRIWN